MKTQTRSQTTFEKYADLVPLVLIALGVALEWVNFPYAAPILILGFLLYGVLGVVISIKRKYYRGISIRLFKLVNDVAIIILTGVFLMGENTMVFLLMLILLDRLILIPRSIANG